MEKRLGVRGAGHQRFFFGWGDGPVGLGHVHGEAEVVVKATGSVFLHDESGFGFDGGFGAGGFGSAVELAFFLVFGELAGARHEGILTWDGKEI